MKSLHSSKGFYKGSTLPLGVLQRKHVELFDPPLPAPHVAVLETDGIVMANLTHVLFQFSPCRNAPPQTLSFNSTFFFFCHGMQPWFPPAVYL